MTDDWHMKSQGVYCFPPSSCVAFTTTDSLSALDCHVGQIMSAVNMPMLRFSAWLIVRQIFP